MHMAKEHAWLCHCSKRTNSFNKVTHIIKYFCSQWHRNSWNLCLKRKISISCTCSCDEKVEINISAVIFRRFWSLPKSLWDETEITTCPLVSSFFSFVIHFGVFNWWAYILLNCKHHLPINCRTQHISAF